MDDESTPTLGDATRSKIPGGVRGIQNSKLMSPLTLPWPLGEGILKKELHSA